MIKNIKVIFDRKKTVEKTGFGKIDICIYLMPRLRGVGTNVAGACPLPLSAVEM